MRVDTAGLANPATARAFGVNSVMMRNRAALVERLFLDGEDVIRP
jgi:hypothetical protein